MEFSLMRITITKTLICIAALCCFITPAFTQPYRMLTPDDFKGPPLVNNGGMLAYTNCSIDYRYEAKKQTNYYLLNFTITLKVNDTVSWLDRKRIISADMMDEVLKHEQGHYIIAYMEQQELLRTVSKIIFYADYRYQAARVFNRIDAKYKQLNLNYDTDTQHMTNREQQRSWDAYFKKQLKVMPPA